MTRRRQWAYPNQGGTSISNVILQLNGEDAITVPEGGGRTAITVSVSGEVADQEEDYSRPVVVDITTAAADRVGTFSPALPITVTASVEADDNATADTVEGEMVIMYTPPAVEDDDPDDTADSPMTLQASAGTETNDATLTVTDINIISEVEVTINGDAAFSIGEDDGARPLALGVSITFDSGNSELEAGQTRTVVVDVAEDEDNPLVGTFNPALPVTVTATLSSPTSAAGSMAITYTPAADDDTDDAMFSLVGSTDGQDGDPDADPATGTDITPVTVTVTDNDTVSEIVLDLNGDTAGTGITIKEDAGATTVTLTATVTLVAGASGARDVVVDLATGGVGSFSMTTVADGVTTTANVASVTVNVPDGSPGTADVIYTPAPDADTDSEEIKLEASIANESATGEATLTVEDVSTSAGTITITTSLDELRENVRARDVVVTASLSKASTDDVTVAVKAEVIGQDPEDTETVTAEIVIAAGDTENSVTVSLDPANDEVFTDRTIRVTGSADAAGYTSDTADIAVLDDDDSIGTLTITVASPPSVTTGYCYGRELDGEGLDIRQGSGFGYGDCDYNY